MRVGKCEILLTENGSKNFVFPSAANGWHVLDVQNHGIVLTPGHRDPWLAILAASTHPRGAGEPEEDE